MNNDLLVIKQLSKQFKLNSHKMIKALHNISFSIHQGEILGLAGESGSGKSTLAKIIAGMYTPTTGKIYFNGQDLLSQNLSTQKYASLIQLIFQNVSASLNPQMTIQEIIGEPLKIHHQIHDKTILTPKITNILLQTGLSPQFLNFYPDELSGGQKQRLNIARCLSVNPQLIIADEPVASLDLLIQAQILNLFLDLQQQHKFSMLFIAHDLALLKFIAQRIGVMYKGHLVELAPTNELFANPQHEYTKNLISTICTTDPIYERNKKIINFDPQTFSPKGLWIEISPNHFVLK